MKRKIMDTFQMYDLKLRFGDLIEVKTSREDNIEYAFIETLYFKDIKSMFMRGYSSMEQVSPGKFTAEDKNMKGILIEEILDIEVLKRASKRELSGG